MGNLPEDFVFSQSSLQDFVDCPRRFQLKYLEKQRYPAPEVDNMLEFERRMAQGSLFHQIVHQHLVGIPEAILQARLADNSEVATWFQTYLDNGLINVPERRFPERSLTIMLDNALIMAKFDLVAMGDKALIIDWKTSQKLPKAQWMRRKMQTIVYRYGLAKGGARLAGKPITPDMIEMRYWYAAHNGEMISFTYDSEQMQRDETTLRDLIETIDAAMDFPLTEDTRRCQFCTYRSLCERGRNAGALDEWDALDYDADFEIDIDQIIEIEF